MPELLTYVEVIINVGSPSIVANVYSMPQVYGLRHIKSIGDTIVQHGSFSSFRNLEYIEGNFKPLAKITSPYKGLSLYFNDIKYSFKECERTTGVQEFNDTKVPNLEVDCEEVIDLRQAFTRFIGKELVFKNTENCSNFNGLLQYAVINICKGLTFESATDISNLYSSNNILCIDSCLKGLGEKVLLANSTFYDCRLFSIIPDLIIPNCTSINSIFRGAWSILEIGLCNFSSIISATDAFMNMYYLKKISFVEESIPISLNFSKSKVLELESAKSIIKGLKNYAGTDKEFVYSI